MSFKVIITVISTTYNILPSIKALAAANVSHNDIKPSNFLADWPEGESPSVSNLRIYLTDFGMVDRAGGTPVYCSPEGIIPGYAKPGVSDLYSLGRVFTFLVCENRELFYCLIFMPLKIEYYCNQMRRIIKSFPITRLIKKMTQIKKHKRISIAKVDRILSTGFDLELITVQAMMDKGLEQEFVNEIGEVLENPEEQVSIMLKERLVMVEGTMTHSL